MMHAPARLVVVAGLLAAALSSQRSPENLDFEDGKPERAAPGWFVPTRGYEALVVKRRGGKGHCVHLSRRAGDQPGPFGNVLQAVDARPYRGKTIRLSADVKSKGRGGRAQLWLRVDRAGGKRGFFDNMGDRPITVQKWKRYQIVGKVDEDAAAIYFGMMLIGRSGSAFLDDVKLEVVDDAALPKIEGPRPLAPRGLANVIVFTRLLGYVRYFHPSDQAAQTDWEQFAIAGIRAVESVAGTKELATKLEELFQPVAPTVRVTVGSPPPLYDLLRGADSDPRVHIPDVLRKRSDAWDLLLVGWRHVGVNTTGAHTIYRSRIVEAIPGGIAKRKFRSSVDPKSLVSPRFPLRKKLPGGLHFMVPLSLFKDKKGTLPHGRGTFIKDDLQPKVTADDRATRLAAVALGWNVFQHFYPYFDVVKVDWEQVLRTSLQEAATDKDAAEFLGTLRRMVAQLQDGHGFVSHMADNRTGTLPVAFAWVGDILVVDRVGDSATDHVAPGDVVLKINGHHAGKVLEERGLEVSAATAQFRRYRLAQNLARGVSGETIRLELQRGDDRKPVELRFRAGRPALPEPRPVKISEIKPGIWYVDISRINDKDYLGALDDLKKAKGIVFDFRGYPSTLGSHAFFQHIIQEKVSSAQWHIPILKRPDRDRMEFKTSGWKIRPKKPYLSAKKVFLIDGRAISYAETCMGIVEHYKLGEIVGEATAGTNGNVNPVSLPGGYRVMWTGMKVLKHDGSRHHGVGIKPTVPMARTVAGIRAGKDEFLEKALVILQSGQ